MKVILFQGGRQGATYKIPGENPEAELADLLDGPVVFQTLNDRLTLVTREDGEREGLRKRYRLHRLGREVEAIAGDCAVVATCGQRGKLRSAEGYDLAAAQCYVRPEEG